MAETTFTYPPKPDDGLTRAKPSEAGVDSRHVLGFLDDIEQAGLELHSLLVWRNGVSPSRVGTGLTVPSGCECCIR